MSEPKAHDAQRSFRRAMFVGAAVALALFGWTVFMIVWFNRAPVSVRFGAMTVVKLASVALPGPVLMVFLAFRAWSRGARVLGWIVAAGSIAAAGLLALFSTLMLRPVIGAAAYDDAAREAEGAALALVNADGPAMADSRALRERLAQRPVDATELASLAARMRADAAAVRSACEGLKGLRAAIVAPFEARGVGRRRGEHLAELFFGPNALGGVEKVYGETAAAFDAKGAQLELLSRRAGGWSWGPDGTPSFTDPKVEAEYRRAGVPHEPAPDGG